MVQFKANCVDGRKQTWIVWVWGSFDPDKTDEYEFDGTTFKLEGSPEVAMTSEQFKTISDAIIKGKVGELYEIDD